MKKIILLITLIKCGFSFSQDTIIYDNSNDFMEFHKGTKKIPKQLIEKDTVFFLFEHNKNQKQTYRDAFFNKPITTKESYYYFFKEFETYSLTYMNWLDEKGNTNLATLEFKKSFLRKNKDIILTYNEILDYGPINILNAFGDKKVFVIDKKEIKCRKIIARQVYFGSSMYQE